MSGSSLTLSSHLSFALSSYIFYPLKPTRSPKSYTAFKAPANPKVSHELRLCVSKAVITGPQLWLAVLIRAMNPITGVRSLGRTTADKEAPLGAMSIDTRDERRSRKKADQDGGEETAIGTSAKAEGRCVNNMVLTRLMRFERAAAKKEESAERRVAVENKEPRATAERSNFPWKK